MAELTGWEGILEPGERILWQGRPDAKFYLSGAHVFSGLFGLFFAGFALFWMVLASSAGGFFWMFGLLHFCVGLGIMLAGPLGGAFVRRRTWYTLTDHRAFIATDLPWRGRALADYPITPETRITFHDGDLPSIHFAMRGGPVISKNVAMQRRKMRRTYTSPIGFDRIPDGRHVLSLIRQAQRAQSPDPDQRHNE
jgi:hypothetical protein